MPSALLVDDNANTLSALAELVAAEGFEVSTAPTIDKARGEIARQVPDVVLLDLNLPDGSGMELLDGVVDGVRPPAFVLVTGHASIETAIDRLLTWLLRCFVLFEFSDPNLAPCGVSPGPLARLHTLRCDAGLADTRRAVSSWPCLLAEAQPFRDYVCLHALSSFQRTGFRKDPTATRPRCRHRLSPRFPGRFGHI